MTESATAVKKTSKPLFTEEDMPAKQSPDISITDDVYQCPREALVEYARRENGNELEFAELFFVGAHEEAEFTRRGRKAVKVNGKKVVDKGGDVMMAAPLGTRDKRLRQSQSLAREQAKRALCEVTDPDRPGVFPDRSVD